MREFGGVDGGVEGGYAGGGEHPPPHPLQPEDNGWVGVEETGNNKARPQRKQRSPAHLRHELPLPQLAGLKPPLQRVSLGGGFGGLGVLGSRARALGRARVGCLGFGVRGAGCGVWSVGV